MRGLVRMVLPALVTVACAPSAPEAPPPPPAASAPATAPAPTALPAPSLPGPSEGEPATSPPVLIEQPEPSFSPELADQLEQFGDNVFFKLSIRVRADGTVESVDVLDVRPREAEVARRFAEETAEYVKSFRYRPATRDGSPVPATVEFVVGAGEDN